MNNFENLFPAIHMLEKFLWILRKLVFLDLDWTFSSLKRKNFRGYFRSFAIRQG